MSMGVGNGFGIVSVRGGKRWFDFACLFTCFVVLVVVGLRWCFRWSRFMVSRLAIDGLT